MERLTKRFTDGTFYCEAVEDVGIEGINAPTYVGEAVNKLADYEDAEEQGLLLRLPVAIGSTIWKFEYPTKVDENGVEWTVLDKKRATVAPLKFAICHLDSIGTLYFVTREEAEQALKQMGE